jgi:hypothetical protein
MSASVITKRKQSSTNSEELHGIEKSLSYMGPENRTPCLTAAAAKKSPFVFVFCFTLGHRLNRDAQMIAKVLRR